MDKELVPLNVVIDNKDSGNFFVSRKQLDEMRLNGQFMLDEAIKALARKSPGYEFMVQEDLFNNGVKIFWRKSRG